MEAVAKRHFHASPEAIAAVMFDPHRDPEWIGGAKSVEPADGDPTAIGSRTTRHGGFLGRKFSWTTEVVEFREARLLRMNFVAGPMKGGDVTYRIEPGDDGAEVTIRNTGPGPTLMSGFVRRSVARDLDRLAAIVEGD